DTAPAPGAEPHRHARGATRGGPGEGADAGWPPPPGPSPHPARGRPLHRRARAGTAHDASARGRAGGRGDGALPLRARPRPAARRRRGDGDGRALRADHGAGAARHLAGVPAADGPRRPLDGDGAPQDLPPGGQPATGGSLAAPTPAQPALGGGLPAGPAALRDQQPRQRAGLPGLLDVPARPPPARVGHLRRRAAAGRVERHRVRRDQRPRRLPPGHGALARAVHGCLRQRVRGLPRGADQPDGGVPAV
ncbi:MAG: Transcriptional regulator, AcrR family, partial [uncultured Friedmanniella sp.]